MAFPSNPSNGDTYLRYGRTYEYDSAMAMWKVKKSGIAIDDLDDVDITTVTPQSGDALQWNGTNFVPFNTAKLVSYATIAELPLVGAASGQMAYVQENGRLYIFNGAGWFSVALVNIAPTITTGPDASYVFATDGTPIVLTLEAQDPEEVPISWSYQVSSGVLGSTATIVQDGNVFTITPSTSDSDSGEFSITFIASDGVNLATAASSFTLSFGVADAYYNLNSTLIKTGSTAGLDNITFVDESTNGFTVTRTGDVYQGSLSPHSPAGWSGYFDGTGDYLSIPTSATGFSNLYPETTSDFTAECWVYINSLKESMFVGQNNSTVLSWAIRIINTNAITFSMNGVDTSSGVIPTIGRWYHLAIVYDSVSDKQYGFIDGVKVVDVALASITPNAACEFNIGARNNTEFNSNAYISDVRIVKGTAVYTSNFTPPTEKLTAISGTSLLTLQDNRFVDRSTNNFAITRYGNAKVVPNSPYLSSEQYDPVVHGGSMYFDNTGDELSIPNDTGFQFGTGDFTIELWVYYASSADVNGTLIGLNTASVGNWAIIGSGGLLYFQNGNASSSLMYPYTPPFGQWAHIAWTRSGSINRAFINGVQVSGDVSNPTNYNGTGTLTIGNGVAYATHQGYIADVRVVKGTAVYTSNFTPPTQSLTAISGTSLLVRGANAGVYDEMGKNNISLIGNTTTSTTATKYHDTSIYFDGSGDTLILPAEAMNFGTGDFTIETWIRPSVFDRGLFRKTTYADSLSPPSISVYMASTTLYVGVNGSSTGAWISASNPFTLNTWAHFAIVRDSGTVKIFVNGTLLTSASNSVNVDNATTVRIGEWRNASEYFNGYLEDFRLTKGYARYTANFTPPTAPLGFSNAE